MRIMGSFVLSVKSFFNIFSFCCFEVLMVKFMFNNIRLGWSFVILFSVMVGSCIFFDWKLVWWSIICKDV